MYPRRYPMKYNFTFTILLLICFSATLLAQDKDYTISASVKKHPSKGMAYLQYEGLNGKIVDSVAIEGGSFTFKGKVDEPRPASIVIKEPGGKVAAQHMIKFYIEPLDIAINSKMMLSTADIMGSPASADRKKMDKLLLGDNFAQPEKVQVVQTTQIVAVPAGSMPPRAISQSRGRPMPSGQVINRRVITDINELPYEMQSAIRAMRDEAKGKVLQFIKDHPDSFVSMYTLNSLWEAKRLTYAEYIPLLNGLSENLVRSNQGKVMFGVK
ncbi:DUF4369 domain-containing protein [Daejeonella sp. JGW-45]|uniref:DUF4369 domain-containing protein n=1 Tax=Daejeonella sp. JGW-45 TaxID=3034148 RepID=UPI0023ED1BBC|nr:DUF4369 domain-containing protein [Daejeonella sp. JGW-45]